MRREILLSLAILLPFSATANFPPPIAGLEIRPIPLPIGNIITLDSGGSYGDPTATFTVSGGTVLSMSAADTVLQASSLTNLGTLNLSGVVELDAGAGTLSSPEGAVLTFGGYPTVYGSITSLGNGAMGLTLPVPGPHHLPPDLPPDLGSALEASCDLTRGYIYATGSISLDTLNVTSAEALTQGRYLLAVSDTGIDIKAFTAPAAGFLVTDTIQGQAGSSLQIAYLDVISSQDPSVLVLSDFAPYPSATYETQQSVLVNQGSSLNLTGTVIQAEGMTNAGNLTVDSGAALFFAGAFLSSGDCALGGLASPPIGPHHRDPELVAGSITNTGKLTVDNGAALVAESITSTGRLAVGNSAVVYAGAGGFAGGDCALGLTVPPLGPHHRDPAILAALENNGIVASSFISAVGDVAFTSLSITFDSSIGMTVGSKYLVALSEGANEPSSGSVAVPAHAAYVDPVIAVSPGREIHVAYVEIIDDTDPTISVPGDIAVAATSSSGATVNYAVSAEDPAPASGIRSLGCDHPSGSLFPVGKTTVTCTATDNAGHSTSAHFNVSVLYSFTGFFSPVENNVTNVAKAGSAIPVKFRLGGNMGLNIFAAGYPASIPSFDNSAPVAGGVIDAVAADASGLQYDPIEDVYTYVWKTDKSWVGTQRQLQFRLIDGAPLRWVAFRFK
jgi:hypothetical protein